MQQLSDNDKFNKVQQITYKIEWKTPRNFSSSSLIWDLQGDISIMLLVSKQSLIGWNFFSFPFVWRHNSQSATKHWRLPHLHYISLPLSLATSDIHENG